MDRARLYVVPLDGGSPRAVAFANGELSGLTWTADGKSIVYAEDGELWRVGAEGGKPESMLSGRDAVLPTVARAGGRLAYTQQTTNVNIWRLPLADAARTAGPPARLVSSSRTQRQPACSPDGRLLAFESTRSGSSEVWTSNADGTEPVRMTWFGGPLTGTPQWSPDGRQIAFDSRAPGEPALYVVDSQGGPPRRVPTGVRHSSEPSWSRDSRWFYFSAVLEGGEQQVFKVASAGGTATPLTRNGGRTPRASPDGTRVYYVKINGPAVELWTVPAEGGDERLVPGMPTRALRDPSGWVVGSRGLYFIDATQPRPRIHFLDSGTAQVRHVFDLPAPLDETWGGLALAPDERALLYSQVDQDESDIMLIEGFR